MPKVSPNKTRATRRPVRKPNRSRLAETTAALMELAISYIDSPDFRTVSRSQLLSEVASATIESQTVAPPETPPYLAALYHYPLLTREQEFAIFRKMNFLLFEAAELQRELTLSDLNSRKVKQIHSRLQEAKEVRNRIVQCNLRLVVSIAKTMVDSANSLEDLISDGNLPLIRAAEIFDFTRGLRFSTYATWAVRNGLYRATHRSRRQQARYRLDDADWLYQTESQPHEPDMERLIDRPNLDHLVSQLDPRCQAIIRDRFALSGQGKPAKFRELAAKLRLSSERVRQLLERALDQLRELSITSEVA